MQALVNQGKTRGFNCLFRVLHYGILLVIVNRCTNTSMILCSEASLSYHHLLYLINLGVIILAALGVMYVHFKYQFPRVQFFVALVVEGILVGIILWISFGSIGNRQNECIQVILLQKWAIFGSLRLIVEVSAVMIFKLFWIQRYTNGPGNIIWGYMFLTISWQSVPIVKSLFFAIGVTYLIISSITLILNLVSRKADTPTFAKYLEYWWILSIVIMFIFEGFAIGKLISNEFTKTFYEIGAKRMLYIFIIGNLVDIVFWGWGLLTLRVQSGDVVREGISEEQQEQQEIEKQKALYAAMAEANKRKSISVNEFGTIHK